LLEFLNSKNDLLKHAFSTEQGKELAFEKMIEFEKNIKELEKELKI